MEKPSHSFTLGDLAGAGAGGHNLGTLAGSHGGRSHWSWGRLLPGEMALSESPGLRGTLWAGS